MQSIWHTSTHSDDALGVDAAVLRELEEEAWRAPGMRALYATSHIPGFPWYTVLSDKPARSYAAVNDRCTHDISPTHSSSFSPDCPPLSRPFVRAWRAAPCAANTRDARRGVIPYEFTFRVFVKGRWVGQPLLRVYSTELAHHSATYYRACLADGRLRCVPKVAMQSQHARHNIPRRQMKRIGGTLDDSRAPTSTGIVDEPDNCAVLHHPDYPAVHAVTGSMLGDKRGMPCANSHTRGSCCTAHDVDEVNASSADVVLQHGDVVLHTVHRHEIPITSAGYRVRPIRLLAVCIQTLGLLCVDKPSGLPTHATGRYAYNSMQGMLEYVLSPRRMRAWLCEQDALLQSLVCTQNLSRTEKDELLEYYADIAADGSKEIVTHVTAVPAVAGGAPSVDAPLPDKEDVGDAVVSLSKVPRPCYRLDRATSGVVLLGVTHDATRRVSALLMSKSDRVAGVCCDTAAEGQQENDKCGGGAYGVVTHPRPSEHGRSDESVKKEDYPATHAPNGSFHACTTPRAHRAEMNRSAASPADSRSKVIDKLEDALKTVSQEDGLICKRYLARVRGAFPHHPAGQVHHAPTHWISAEKRTENHVWSNLLLDDASLSQLTEMACTPRSASATTRTIEHCASNEKSCPDELSRRRCAPVAQEHGSVAVLLASDVCSARQDGIGARSSTAAGAAQTAMTLVQRVAVYAPCAHDAQKRAEHTNTCGETRPMCNTCGSWLAAESLLVCVPLTGRMHQIRIHLRDAGFPVVGDTLYDPDDKSDMDCHCTTQGGSNYVCGESTDGVEDTDETQNGRRTCEPSLQASTDSLSDARMLYFDPDELPKAYTSYMQNHPGRCAASVRACPTRPAKKVVDMNSETSGGTEELVNEDADAEPLCYECAHRLPIATYPIRGGAPAHICLHAWQYILPKEVGTDMPARQRRLHVRPRKDDTCVYAACIHADDAVAVDGRYDDNVCRVPKPNTTHHAAVERDHDSSPGRIFFSSSLPSWV